MKHFAIAGGDCWFIRPAVPDSMAAPVDRADEAEDDDEVGENGFDTVRCATCEMSEVIEGSAEVREHSLARCVGDWIGGE